MERFVDICMAVWLFVLTVLTLLFGVVVVYSLVTWLAS